MPHTAPVPGTEAEPRPVAKRPMSSMRHTGDSISEVWRPSPGPGAAIVPLAVFTGGVAGSAYLHQVVGSIPLAALAGTLGLVSALFCRVLLKG